MNLIQKEILKVNYIVDQYKDDIETYKTQSDLILNEFKRIIDELAPSFGLISQNSVRTIKSYSFIHRVKEDVSLKEKIIRSNLLNKFNPILPDGFTPNGTLNRGVKDKLYELDDLIGIKILTDLIIDCKKMYELIKSPEFKDKATSKGISLDEIDMAEQPQTMRNGLEIYKIKGEFKNFKFELQIKSKITSAWGDMEHSIFYKDYEITPVRDTAQKSMNHVGKLLFDIDDFVESIRSANKDYEANANALLFLSWFDRAYNEMIKTHLSNVSYRFEVIAELLYQTSIQLNIKRSEPIKNLRIDHFELNPKNQHLINYTTNRNKSYDLKILEGVIISWQLDEVMDISEKNIDEILTSFLETIVISSASYLQSIFNGFDVDEIQAKLNDLFQISLLYECNERFLIDLHKLTDYFETVTYVDELTEIIKDSSEKEKLLVDMIQKAIFIKWHDGNSTEYLTSTIANSSEPIEEDDLKKSILQIQSLIPINEKRDLIGFRNLLSKLIND